MSKKLIIENIYIHMYIYKINLITTFQLNILYKCDKIKHGVLVSVLSIA